MGSAPDNNFLDGLPVALFRCLHDAKRTMLTISHGCEALTGYPAQDFLAGGPIGYGDLILLQDKFDLMHQIDQDLKEGRPYNVTYRIKTAAGIERWVQEQGQAVYNADGSVQALEGLITDQHDIMLRFRSLEQRVADRTGRLSALYEILEAASDAGTTQTTISRILERVLEAVGVDAGAIHLIDAGGEFLQLVAQQGLPEIMLDANTTLNLQDSPLVGLVARKGSPLLIPEISQDIRAAALAEDSAYSIYAGVPITAADQIYGVLSILATENARFHAQEEIDLLVSVGEQIGVVLENGRLRQHAEQLTIVEERNRLARELHDSVTQSLYSVTLFAEAGRRMILKGDSDQAQTYLNDVTDISRQALKEMRLLVHRLRPSILAEEGLVRAIQHRLNAVEGRAGVINNLIVEGDIQLSPKLEETLYYITQEALNNALKHAAATEVIVILRAHEDGQIELHITDNGRGFDPGQVTELGGLGLTSMRERAEMSGGQVTCSSSPGQGTTVYAQFAPALENINGAPQQNPF